MTGLKTTKLKIAGLAAACVVLAAASYYAGRAGGQERAFERGQSAGYSEGYATGFKKGRRIGHRKVLDKIDHHLANLKIQNLPSIDYGAVFSRHHLEAANITTFDQLHQVLFQRFQDHADKLGRKWHIKNNKKLEALFYMNAVSRLWGFGNRHHPEQKGCVGHNEITGPPQHPGQPKTVRDYLESSIGCCSDSAQLLGYLLQRAGIQHQIIRLPGHVLNQALLDNQWVTLDAHTGMMLHTTWNRFRDADPRTTPLHVTLFPHHNLLPNTPHSENPNPFYRERVGQFRIILLLQAMYRAGGKAVTLELPAFFTDNS